MARVTSIKSELGHDYIRDASGAWFLLGGKPEIDRVFMPGSPEAMQLDALAAERDAAMTYDYVTGEWSPRNV